MAFQPRHCPYENCEAKQTKGTPFFQRWGTFCPMSKNRPVERFRCRSCKRTFSRQTFRYDFRQRKPHLDALLLRQLVSGVGIRQSARILGTSRQTIARKLTRLSQQCRALHDKLAREIRGHRHLQFDELETFETCRVSKPVTMGTIIDVESMFILEQENGMMGPRGNLSKRSMKLVERHERESGKRQNESRRVVADVFERAKNRLAPESTVDLTTDEKTTYAPLARAKFGDQLRNHVQVSSKAPRSPGSALHPINLTQAMWRDGLGRLRRRSWLASKRRSWLEKHAWIYVAFRNYVRPRFNGDESTPGMVIGVQKKMWRFEDLLGWNRAMAS